MGETAENVCFKMLRGIVRGKVRNMVCRVNNGKLRKVVANFWKWLFALGK